MKWVIFREYISGMRRQKQRFLKDHKKNRQLQVLIKLIAQDF